MDEDEDEVREDEVREDEQQVGEPAEGGDETEAVEDGQAAEEHDWGSIEARLDDMEQRINDMAEAMATMSINAEDGAVEDPAEEVDEEYGEAVDLDEIENMLGL